MTESRSLFARPSDDRNATANAEKLKTAQEDLQRQHDANRATTKRMNQLARDFLVLKTNYTVPDWQTKYNDAIEARKEAEKTVCNFIR